MARADAATASWVSTTPFGSPGGAAGGDDQGVAVLGRLAGPRIGGQQRRSLAGPGSRGSTGSTASPASHTRRSRSTNAVAPGRSIATSRRTAARLRACPSPTPPPTLPPKRPPRLPRPGRRVGGVGGRRPAPHPAGRRGARAGRHRLRGRRHRRSWPGGRWRPASWRSPSRSAPTTPTTTATACGAPTTSRVGPLRLVGSGLGSPGAVKRAALVRFGVAAVAGLALDPGRRAGAARGRGGGHRGGVVLHRRVARPTATWASASCSCSCSSGWWPPPARPTCSPRRCRALALAARVPVGFAGHRAARGQQPARHPRRHRVAASARWPCASATSAPASSTWRCWSAPFVMRPARWPGSATAPAAVGGAGRRSRWRAGP